MLPSDVHVCVSIAFPSRRMVNAPTTLAQFTSSVFTEVDYYMNKDSEADVQGYTTDKQSKDEEGLTV
jgi:hypothetical protein